MEKSKNTIENYIMNCADSVKKTDFEILANIADMIFKSKNKNRIFTAGNGGSASTASHIVNDLVKGCRVGDNTGFDAMCLSDSSTVVTCLGNDFAYEDVYKIQLETFAKANDLLIVFSGSGNSPNIIKGCETAKKIGMKVIAFGGRDGGKMKNIADICLVAPTNSMEMLEDMHLMYEHALVVAIKELLS